MNSIARPIKAFSIAIWSVECCLKLLDTLCRTTKPEYPFNVGS